MERENKYSTLVSSDGKQICNSCVKKFRSAVHFEE